MSKIILATSSPYRQEAFRFLNLEFIAESSNVDEYFEGRPNSPEELVSHLAKLKGEAVAKNHQTGILIAFDSIGWFNNQPLEKPKSREDAFARLKAMSGNSHGFYTGIYMINIDSGQVISRVVETNVQLRDFTDAEINKYLDQDPNYSTYAIGYDPLESYSSTFIKNLTGSYNNITRGIPLEAIVEMLWEIGYQL